MSPVIEHLQQVFMLHRLIDLGLDNELADHLRDEMDETWKALSQDHDDWLREVSARLNAERDVDTAVRTERVKELDWVMQYLACEHRERVENREAGEGG